MRRQRSNDPCWCGSEVKYKRCHGERAALARSTVSLGQVSPPRDVPAHIARPPYLRGERTSGAGPQVQDAASLERLRHACRIAAEVLLEAGAAVEPGVTTDELDAIAHAAYVRQGAYPSTLGYKGFPKSVCTSVNGVICHGIPDDRPLAPGDIVNVDVTAYAEGMHGDTSATFVVGDVDRAVLALVETTREATLRGIRSIAPGRLLSAIGDAIEPFAASRGFGVVREYGGHGIGEVFHAAPHVDHVRTARREFVFVPGMSLTVEPMLTSGRPEFAQAADGWTEAVLDAMPSAQFEHTVVVTDVGVEILTVTADGASAVDAASAAGHR
ncbi:MAG: type I methionyl aminopeptidase [Acidimicrobiales bacterium]|nr:type I methionyl aminopeptidase [Acidimicrobiales bacterium]